MGALPLYYICLFIHLLLIYLLFLFGGRECVCVCVWGVGGYKDIDKGDQYCMHYCK